VSTITAAPRKSSSRRGSARAASAGFSQLADDADLLVAGDERKTGLAAEGTGRPKEAVGEQPALGAGAQSRKLGTDEHLGRPERVGHFDLAVDDFVGKRKHDGRAFHRELLAGWAGYAFE